MEVDDKGVVVKAIDGADEEPLPKRPRHAAFAPSSSSSPSLSLKQQLSPLAAELAQAVRTLVEADKKADEAGGEQEEEDEDEEEEERGTSIRRASTPSSAKTSSASTAPLEVSAAASALEKLLLALSRARRKAAAAAAGGGQKEEAVPEELERALDEWRQGVEVKEKLLL